jgi:hypothetical protein
VYEDSAECCAEQNRTEQNRLSAVAERYVVCFDFVLVFAVVAIREIVSGQ